MQYRGKQVLLAKGKANKAEAMAAYHTLMLQSGESPSKTMSLPIATLCDLFLDFTQQHHALLTFKNYHRVLQQF